MANNEAGDENSIGGDHGVEALWAAVEETRQQVAQIREMLAAGINLNANNRPPVDRARAEGIARGHPVVRRRNPAPRIQPDNEMIQMKRVLWGTVYLHLRGDQGSRTIIG